MSKKKRTTTRKNKKNINDNKFKTQQKKQASKKKSKKMESILKRLRTDKELRRLFMDEAQKSPVIKLSQAPLLVTKGNKNLKKGNYSKAFANFLTAGLVISASTIPRHSNIKQNLPIDKKIETIVNWHQNPHAALKKSATRATERKKKYKKKSVKKSVSKNKNKKQQNQRTVRKKSKSKSKKSKSKITEHEKEFQQLINKNPSKKEWSSTDKDSSWDLHKNQKNINFSDLSAIPEKEEDSISQSILNPTTGGKRRRKKKTRKKRGGMTLEEIKEIIIKIDKEMQEKWWEFKHAPKGQGKNAKWNEIQNLRNILKDNREELTRLKQEVLEYSGGPEMPIVVSNPNPGGSPCIEGGKRKRRTYKKKLKRRNKTRKRT